METLTLDRPLKTREPRVLLDPALEPGVYRATVALNGDERMAASVRIVVTRDAGPERAEPAPEPRRKRRTRPAPKPRDPTPTRGRSDDPV